MIEILSWDTADRNIEEGHQRKIDRNNQILFREVLSEPNFPQLFPYSVEIETVNRCNNDCSFCPVNRNSDTRSYRKMPDQLFFQIIGQLAQMDYSGYLSLFSNNEPLLDPRIYDFLEYARKKVPRARLCLFTNGILLNEERFQRLTGSLDYLTIDNYEDSGELLPSVARAIEAFRGQECSCKVKVLLRKKHQVLSTRGGESPNREKTLSFEGTCMMPFMQIVIRPDGKISKCCQDGLGLSCIGDLTKESLRECWENPARKKLWAAMAGAGRGGIEGCRHCDVFGHDNYLPDPWKPMIVQAFLRVAARQALKQRKLILSGPEPARKKIEALLRENGMAADQVFAAMEGQEICDQCFYILGEYEEPFLERLDPNSSLAGERWIVYEKIPEYIHHDRTKPVFRFAGLMNALFQNWNRRFCYWGDDETLERLQAYLKLPAYRRFTGRRDAQEYVGGREQEIFCLLAEGREEERLFLTRELGLLESQVLSFGRIMDFLDTL